MSLDIVREYLHKLVAARYVERCPSAEPMLVPPNEEDTPAKKRSAKSAKVIAYSCELYLHVNIFL